MSDFKVDKFGNASGPVPTVPDMSINGGGLSLNEITQAEAAKVRADAEQAAAAAVAKPVLAEYEKEGHS